MRIIGGKYRGMVLAEFKGNDIRPTADRVKESLFNILMYDMPSARVLDLFCGSGNVGLEAISRGASFVHFNDFSRDSLFVLTGNLKKLKGENNFTVTCADYLTCLSGLKTQFDIIFIDPPYRYDYGVPALQKIAERNLLADGGVVIYERDRSFQEQVEGWEKVDERKYGKTYITFFRLQTV